ncbi:transglutaminase-like putative cysteine protease [Leifsonia sp. AK011]|uniref:transglutaminase family protein n=1 Tax=Leifsonia sp. AK011 TaxID=2723075 RepID=UPI0015CAE88E|nr:transglutaminase domain-containing protein [Leifsonia sp. AK011]NYF11327.1 transglutaminase-like putative cysteine protease [Leifsonia sp. AK011]
MSERQAETLRDTGQGLRLPSGRTWADIAVLLVLALLGVIGFEPSFGGYGFLVAGLGGLVLGAATGILASVFRLGAITTALGAIVLYFLIGTPLAVPAQAVFVVFPSLQSLASIAIGTVYGWADIVTLSTPIGAPQYIAVVPYFAAWIVALVSTTLATRWLSARPRTAWRFGVALIAPVALYLAGILIGTDEPYQAGMRGIVFGVLALVWLGWRRQGLSVAQEGAARLRRRKLAGTAAIVAGAVLLGGAAGFWAAPANDQRFVLREEIDPPFDPLDYPSPLSGFRHYTKQVTDDVLFTVEGLQVGDVIRVATLDSFTGKLWNVTGPESSADGSGSFALVGRDLPAPAFITPTERDNITFTIADYDDVWIPSVGYATDLDFTDGAAASQTDSLRYNALTGTAVLTTGLTAGDRYTIDAEAQEVLTPEDLRDAEIAPVELPPIEGSPDIVTVRAQEFAGSSESPIAQLEAIRVALVDTGFLSHGRASDAVPSRAGHGADRITELFERNQMVGDQEQYASAFALMARSLGYPARVVMGFAPDIAEGQASVDVTGDDVTAWVEVAFEGVGWVAFNPTPDETDIPQDQVPKPQSEPQPQVRQPPRADNDDEKLLSPVELEETEDDDNGLEFIIPGWVYVLALSVLIPAALFFIPLLIIGAIKARRSRRRRGAPEGHDQVAGAWEELTDQYSELGFTVPQRLTRPLVAAQLEQQLHVEELPRLRSLAATTDEAVFSGHPVDESTAEQVWTEALAAVAVAKSTLSGWRRLVSRFRIRSAREWVARLGSPRAGR